MTIINSFQTTIVSRPASVADEGVQVQDNNAGTKPQIDDKAILRLTTSHLTTIGKKAEKNTKGTTEQEKTTKEDKGGGKNTTQSGSGELPGCSFHRCPYPKDEPK